MLLASNLKEERPSRRNSSNWWTRGERRFRHPGRKRLDDRAALCGVLFVLYTGIPWEFLPQELGFGSGMTCWRRLREIRWEVRDDIHEAFMALASAIICWRRLKNHSAIEA